MRKNLLLLFAFALPAVFSFGQGTNDLSVEGLYTDKGKINNLFQTSTEAHVIIKNNSANVVTNTPVTVSVTGANPYSIVQTLASLAAGATDTLHFTNIPIVNLGSQTVNASLPTDNVPSNDMMDFAQYVSCDTVSHNNNGPINLGVGYDTGTGILANIYELPASTVSILVKKSTVIMATGTANVGNKIKGVLLNSAGVIVDSSVVYTIANADLGNPVSLTFLNGNVDYSGQTIYVGIRQIQQTSGVGFFPCATQAPVVVKDSTYFGFETNGGGMASYNTLGTFMLDAVMTAGVVSLSSGYTNDSICDGALVNLIASPVGFDNYNFSLNGASIQNSAVNTYSFNATGTTTFDLALNKNSCSYVIGLDSLTAVVDYTQTMNESICDGESYTFDGQNISTAGQYSTLLSAVGGCDSLVVLNLAVNQTSSLTLTEEICQGDSYYFVSQNLTTTGVYSFTTTNAGGCDSLVTLNLTVNPASETELNESICTGTTYFFNNQNISAAGVYYEVHTGVNSCDSIVTLNLSIETVDPSVMVSGDTITATTTNAAATFQWVDCDNNNMAIAGATSSVFKPGVTGNYAVIVTQNGCTATSACNNIDYTGLSEALVNAVEIYPNPVSQELFIQPNSMTLTSIKVLTMEGKEILLKTDVSNGIIQIDLGELENGTYILELKTPNALGRKLFVKS
ncbi:T9SS type A sorting domain-containing protein [Putridiphycobacter roseus]|nr:T9SS type A sorting domain-containing protein [Putridiphycobacter roseus]